MFIFNRTKWSISTSEIIKFTELHEIFPALIQGKETIAKIRLCHQPKKSTTNELQNSHSGYSNPWRTKKKHLNVC